MVHARAQADFFQRFARQLAPFGTGQGAVQQRQFDIVDHAQVVNQVEALEDETKGRVAQRGDL
ncbi:MAG: hypothetical protein WKG03_15630, partial [Telluria sp.]